MMDCKKALVEADGDFTRALDLLRERGLGKARGKAGRPTSDGRVAASVSDDGRVGALIEVNCETDFVARTDDFSGLCDELAALVRELEPGDVAVFLDAPHVEGTVKDRLAEAVLKLGENIQIARLDRLEAGPDGHIASYIHAGGKIGALVQVQGQGDEARSYAHNVCMHVAAANPLGVSRDDVPAKEVEYERNVLRKQAEGEGKPEQIVEKMVEGRLSKFFKEVVLTEQPLVMDPDKTVAQAGKEAGAEPVAFLRFQLGEEAEA
jgi:elongation factor Ts